MQALANYSTTQFTKDININFTEDTDCLEIRRSLNALFDGSMQLETSTETQKMRLFDHLQKCETCCRSFDVRTRFRPARRNGIF